uniref:MTH1187 family thiamine-binding protein n=1 Tax=Synechococcus sp. UW106 TaxID=368495 RepID=UPI000E0EEB04|nr:MTH1187 family thiamine-binding protein [Synechococcus sp. UW106]
MWVSVDLCVVPIGVGVSLSPYIAACERVIAATGLKHQLGPNGTAIEGPWEEVMACVRACHVELHSMGAPRLYTTLKLNTRTDRQQSFSEKVASVENLLSD